MTTANEYSSIPEQRLDDSAQQALAVTIYHQNLALVKDRRRCTLTAGENRLAWRTVSAQIRPETALLSAVAGAPPISLLEQNFDFDLLTPDSLLNKYRGRQVHVMRTLDDGTRLTEAAQVLATNKGVVLRYADRIETEVIGHLSYPDLPADLRDQPTLVLHLEAAANGSGDYELSYLTGGLAWRADYVANLAAAGQTMDLNGWVTLTNHSGIAYRHTRLQLVAGEVHQVEPPEESAMAYRPMVCESRAALPAEEALDEYHLYTLARPTDILQNQTKQVALLSAAAVPIHRELVVRASPYSYQSSSQEGWTKLKVTATLNFTNLNGDLGLPLPKGIVRVYTQDSRGQAQFIGEDEIDHTPKGETVTLTLGESFDITVRRKQTDFVKLGGTGPYNYLQEAAFAMELQNAKPDAVLVTVVEEIPGDWEVLAESQPHTKQAAHLAAWQVAIAAEGKTTLTWRVRIRH
ncbi:MAG: DUF4139 domain-containing protein [Chromatiaceae bacterium]